LTVVSLVVTVTVVKREPYKAVTSQVPLLIPCLPNEHGHPATFFPVLPGKDPPLVRPLSHSEAAEALRKSRNTREHKHYAAIVGLLMAVQSGNSEAQELECQRLYFSMVPKPQSMAEAAVAQWLRSTPLSKIESIVKADTRASAKVRDLFLAAIRGLQSVQEPHRVLCWEVTRTLFMRIRLVLWWDGNRFLPAIYCEDRTVALYIRVLLRASRGEGIATCLKCGEWFLQGRANQDYCTIAHREAHRVARWRSRQKKHATRKGNKRGSRKA